MRNLKISVLVLLLSFATVSTHADSAPFQAFGGTEGLTRVTDDFLEELLIDPLTRRFFELADEDDFRELMVELFCELLDGGCVYSGRSMREIHRGMSITEAHFNAVIEALQRAMEKNGIPFRAQNQLLAKLAPMHRDIVRESPR
jgi:hemoglobin